MCEEEGEVAPLTELSGRFDVHVVEAGADAHNDAQAFELVQVVSGQGDGVVQQGAHRLVQHLDTRTDTDTHTHTHINVIETSHLYKGSDWCVCL